MAHVFGIAQAFSDSKLQFPARKNVETGYITVAVGWIDWEFNRASFSNECFYPESFVETVDGCNAMIARVYQSEV